MDFLKVNYIYILVLSILIFISLVIFDILNNDFSDVPSYKKQHIEPYNNKETEEDTMSGAFCKKYQGTPHLLKKHCKNLGVKGCHVAKCCVLINDIHCMPGDHHGPTFKTDNGKEINIDYFHHKGECRKGINKCPE